MKKEAQKKSKDVAITRQGIVGWFLVFILVSAVMFSLGVIVGRGTSPVSFNLSGIEKDIQDLKEIFASTSKDLTGKKLCDQPKIEFYENLKKEDNNDEINIKTISPSKVERPKTPGIGINDTEEQPTATPPDTNDATPQEAPKKEAASIVKVAVPEPAPPKPVPEPPRTESKGRYTIQVGAFKNLEDAQKLVENLTGKGYDAYRSIGKTPDGNIWFRVRIGDFSEKESAGNMLEKLKKDSIKGYLLNR